MFDVESRVPVERIRALGGGSRGSRGEYVVYWMVAARRIGWNFGLQRAAEWARELECGVIILEALRSDYPWASDRLHRFVLDGMAEHAAALQGRPGVAYYPYVEPEAGAGRGLLEALAQRAAVVVTDDYPTFFHPRMLAAAASRITCTLEAVDGNGLVPMRNTDTIYPSAHTFRRYLQRSLPEALSRSPAADPLRGLPRVGVTVPAPVLDRWPDASRILRHGGPDVAALPVDHSVSIVAERGGTDAARRRLERFLEAGLSRYAMERNQPEADATSGLSPYLHFGHISVHEILDRIAAHEGWTPSFEGRRADGRRAGWWGLSGDAESLLDELVTWRELGFNMAALDPDHHEYGSLPEWARRTLSEHAGDRREHLYSLEQLEAADTHDDLWNAAQIQLRREGRIHGYLRMLWGKKVLEWTQHPRDAARFLIELNNRYALDGRDPNSYSGIYWCLGRYDRPWGPERPVFGKIRYMSSRNTARKLRVRDYMARYAELAE